MTKRILVNGDKEARHSSACSFKNRTMSDFPGIEMEALDCDLELFLAQSSPRVARG